MVTKNVASRISRGNGLIVKHNSRGTVRWFNNERGIGFVTDESSTFGDVFIHRANILTADEDEYTGRVYLRHSVKEVLHANVEKGDVIEYDILEHTSGNLQAKNITFDHGEIIVTKLARPDALKKQSDIDPLADCPSGQPMSWQMTQLESGSLYMTERMADALVSTRPADIETFDSLARYEQLTSLERRWCPQLEDDGYESSSSIECRYNYSYTPQRKGSYLASALDESESPKYDMDELWKDICRRRQSASTAIVRTSTIHHT